MKDPKIMSLEGLEDMIREEDATCLRSLYTRLKEIFSDSPEYRFDLDDNQTKEIHLLLDKTYNDLLTDNALTDDIFKEAQTRNYYETNCLLWKNVIEEQRQPEFPVFRFRPYNMESKAFHNIVHNSSIINNIDSENLQVEDIKELIEENERLLSFIAEKYNSNPSRKGRPKKHDYITEQLITIRSLNDLIPILQRQSQTREQALRERVTIKKTTMNRAKKVNLKCTLCLKSGKLLSCESCPVSYHPT